MTMCAHEIAFKVAASFLFEILFEIINIWCIEHEF